MLAKAQQKAKRESWDNVELVTADVESYSIPAETNAVISTFALEMIPRYAEIILSLSEDMPHGARLGLHGFKHPEKWPKWLVKAGILATKIFGVNKEYEDFEPWVPAAKSFCEIKFQELYGGAAYLWLGANERP